MKWWQMKAKNHANSRAHTLLILDLLKPRNPIRSIRAFIIPFECIVTKIILDTQIKYHEIER